MKTLQKYLICFLLATQTIACLGADEGKQDPAQDHDDQCVAVRKDTPPRKYAITNVDTRETEIITIGPTTTLGEIRALVALRDRELVNPERVQAVVEAPVRTMYSPERHISYFSVPLIDPTCRERVKGKPYILNNGSYVPDLSR